jgi:hypothetical protein
VGKRSDTDIAERITPMNAEREKQLRGLYHDIYKLGLNEYEFLRLIDSIIQAGAGKPTKHEKKFENFRDYVLEKEKEGKIVIATFDGFTEDDLDEIIKQPIDGLLYDLNRDRATILTFIEDKKWVNDFACMKVIAKLKACIPSLSEEEKGKDYSALEKLTGEFAGGLIKMGYLGTNEGKICRSCNEYGGANKPGYHYGTCIVGRAERFLKEG